MLRVVIIAQPRTHLSNYKTVELSTKMIDGDLMKKSKLLATLYKG